MCGVVGGYVFGVGVSHTHTHTHKCRCVKVDEKGGRMDGCVVCVCS